MAGDAKFWQEHVAAVERGGWVAKEYARQHDLSVTALYYWRTKLRALASNATSGKFMTLEVVSTMSAAPGACVVSVGGVRLESNCLPAPEWLAALALATAGVR